MAWHGSATEYGWLNSIAPHILAPLYGVPSGLYALHHRVMHHVEGNAASGDLSSTEPYQRDCGLHFLWYYLLCLALPPKSPPSCSMQLWRLYIVMGTVNNMLAWMPIEAHLLMAHVIQPLQVLAEACSGRLGGGAGVCAQAAALLASGTKSSGGGAVPGCAARYVAVAPSGHALGLPHTLCDHLACPHARQLVRTGVSVLPNLAQFQESVEACCIL